MQCEKCGSEWNSSIKMEKCPFCGTILKKEAPTEFADIPSVISYLIQKEGYDVLLESDIVISYIMDLVPKKDREKKLFRLGCDHGVTERVHQILAEPKRNRREIMVLDMKQHLKDNVFMSEENALELINMTLAGVNLSELKLSDPEVQTAPQEIKQAAKKKINPLKVEQIQKTQELLPPDTQKVTQQTKPTLSTNLSQKTTVSNHNQLQQSEKKSDNAHAQSRQPSVSHQNELASTYKQLYTITKSNVKLSVTPMISVGKNLIVGLTSKGTVLSSGCDLSHWKNIVNISAGDDHVVGLRSDGTVIAYHDKGNVLWWTNIVKVYSYQGYTFGVKSDGSVVISSGENLSSLLKDITAMATYHSRLFFLTRYGTVFTYVDDSYGEEKVTDWDDITAISAGENHIIGLKMDGTVVAIGDNQHGQCRCSSSQMRMPFGMVYNKKWEHIIQIAAGQNHTVGLKRDHTVLATGSNSVGQCNVSEWSDINAIFTGMTCTIGLKSDGSVVTTSALYQKKISEWNLLD